MKATATLLTFLLIAGTAAAQERERPRTDYSRDRLLRLFVEAGEENQKGPIRIEDGSLQFRAFDTIVRLPLGPVRPLSGTFTNTQQWPDPFVLTNTQIATSYNAWQTRREINAELRRIDRMERARAKVRVRMQ